MSERSNSRLAAVLAVLALAAALPACSQGPSDAWKGPGWYLELPNPVIAGGPAVHGGPFGYDECQTERLRRLNSENYLCVREIKKPPKYGMY